MANFESIVTPIHCNMLSLGAGVHSGQSRPGQPRPHPHPRHHRRHKQLPQPLPVSRQLVQARQVQPDNFWPNIFFTRYFSRTTDIFDKIYYIQEYSITDIFFRFEVKTVTDVVSNMENGIKHVIQVTKGNQFRQSRVFKLW